MVPKRRAFLVKSAPDELGRVSFDIYWPTDYIPGHPDGEHGKLMRAQCFRADVDKYVAEALAAGNEVIRLDAEPDPEELKERLWAEEVRDVL